MSKFNGSSDIYAAFLHSVADAIPDDTFMFKSSQFVRNGLYACAEYIEQMELKVFQLENKLTQLDQEEDVKELKLFGEE